jgi:hypothetical protein
MTKIVKILIGLLEEEEGVRSKLVQIFGNFYSSATEVVDRGILVILYDVRKFVRWQKKFLIYKSSFSIFLIE